MSTVQAPSWFTSERYSFIPTLDAGGWLFHLKRAAYLIDPDWPKHYEEWKAHFDLPDLPKQFDPDIQVWPDYIPPPAVRALEAPQLADMHDIERPALLLKVSLSAPDDVIIHEFKKILSGARKRCPAPVKQRGPQVLKGRFKAEEQFTTWRNYKILEFAELLAWRAYDKVDATDVQLGCLLTDNANIEFDKKRTEVAKKALLAAIDSNSIRALAAQVASEAPAEK
jgi:Family of unknown function (DUF6387)